MKAIRRMLAHAGGAALGVTAAAVLFAGTSARAREPSNYYGPTTALGVWPSGHTEGYFVRNGFPSAAFADRIFDGKSVWNAARESSSEPNFGYSGATSAVGNADSPCDVSFSAFYWRDLDYLGSGVLGATRACKNGIGQTQNFSVSIDSDRAWHVGTNAPPATHFDLWSIAAHEMGHATGLRGHFPEDAACPVSSTRPTMCSGFTGTQGNTWLRDLRVHDTHTFNGAY